MFEFRMFLNLILLVYFFGIWISPVEGPWHLSNYLHCVQILIPYPIFS